jgi:hypothetical protein
VVVQFWLKPGEAVVTLGPGEEREVERIPDSCGGFLQRSPGALGSCPPRAEFLSVSLVFLGFFTIFSTNRLVGIPGRLAMDNQLACFVTGPNGRGGAKPSISGAKACSNPSWNCWCLMLAN